MTLYFYETEFGPLGLAEDDGVLIRVCLPGDAFPDGARIEETPALRLAHAQIAEYLAGKRRAFSVPYEAEGTAFQRAVWHALETVPYGATDTYRGIAIAIDHPRAARAVGMACQVNPLPILVPCHRIVGAGSAMLGYRGGIEMKRRLLEMEACHCTDTDATRSTDSRAATPSSAR